MTASRAQADFRTQKLQVALPGRSLWSEADVTARLALQGGGRPIPQRIDSALLLVDTGGEHLAARLLQPVVDLRDGGAWSWSLHGRGDLDDWSTQLRRWIDCGACACAGKGELTGQLTLDQGGIKAEDLKLTASGLTVAGPSIHLQEPTAEAAFTGGWQCGSRDVQIRQASARVTGLLLRLTDCRLSLAPHEDASLRGHLEYRADLQQLQPWFERLGRAGGWLVAGDLAGQGEIVQDGGGLRASLQSTIDKFTIDGGPGRQFSEPQIRFVARSLYNPQTQALQLEKFELSSRMLAGSLTGRVAGGAEPSIDLAGSLQYDFDKLSELRGPTWATRCGCLVRAPDRSRCAVRCRWTARRPRPRWGGGRPIYTASTSARGSSRPGWSAACCSSSPWRWT